jgi:methanogenic corrinoid protein MtbC1
MARTDEIKHGLYEHTIAGHASEVKQLTQEGIDLGMNPLDMLYGALIPALQEVGRRFEKGEFFVPEMLIAARAMAGAMTLLRPILVQSGVKPVGKVVMLTVKGDMHDIGKNLCDMMLEGAGFTVVDLGVNTSVEKMMAAIEEHQPDLVGFSAFLTTTMPMFKVNIEALEKAGWRDRVKVMVGGAPVTQEYADKVGADGYAPDASSAVRLARRLGLRDESAPGGALVDAVSTLQDVLAKAEE